MGFYKIAEFSQKTSSNIYMLTCP